MESEKAKEEKSGTNLQVKKEKGEEYERERGKKRNKFVDKWKKVGRKGNRKKVE